MNSEESERLPIPGTIMPDPAPEAIYIPEQTYTLHVTYLSPQSALRTSQDKTIPAQTRGEIAELNASFIERGGEPLFLTPADAIRLMHETHPQPADVSILERVRRFGRQVLGH